MTDQPIKCSASGCFRRLTPGMAFCPDHWSALPSDLRDRIYKAKVKPEKYAGARVQAVQWLALNAPIIRRSSPMPQINTDTFVEKAAAIAHEVNRAYCRALGDNSQMSWDDSPTWQKKSAITGVRFTSQHPDAPPSASHESWLAEKRADGWGYGPVKDTVAKLHPCFVPYDELPPEQRAKDYIFQAVVRSVVAQFWNCT